MDCWYAADSLAWLSGLAGSLTRLDLDFTPVPADVLATLTRLQHLEQGIEDEAGALAVAGALPHLTGLTCLVSGVNGNLSGGVKSRVTRTGWLRRGVCACAIVAHSPSVGSLMRRCRSECGMRSPLPPHAACLLPLLPAAGNLGQPWSCLSASPSFECAFACTELPCPAAGMLPRSLPQHGRRRPSPAAPAAGRPLVA